MSLFVESRHETTRYNALYLNIHVSIYFVVCEIGTSSRELLPRQVLRGFSWSCRLHDAERRGERGGRETESAKAADRQFERRSKKSGSWKKDLLGRVAGRTRVENGLPEEIKKKKKKKEEEKKGEAGKEKQPGGCSKPMQSAAADCLAPGRNDPCTALSAFSRCHCTPAMLDDYALASPPPDN